MLEKIKEFIQSPYAAPLRTHFEWTARVMDWTNDRTLGFFKGFDFRKNKPGGGKSMPPGSVFWGGAGGVFALLTTIQMGLPIAATAAAFVGGIAGGAILPGAAILAAGTVATLACMTAGVLPGVAVGALRLRTYRSNLKRTSFIRMKTPDEAIINGYKIKGAPADVKTIVEGQRAADRLSALFNFASAWPDGKKDEDLRQRLAAALPAMDRLDMREPHGEKILEFPFTRKVRGPAGALEMEVLLTEAPPMRVLPFDDYLRKSARAEAAVAALMRRTMGRPS